MPARDAKNRDLTIVLCKIILTAVTLLISHTFRLITGSLTALVVTPNTMLVGASGGDFCLIAAVIANVVLNCDSMHLAGSLIRLLLMGFVFKNDQKCFVVHVV